MQSSRRPPARPLPPRGRHVTRTPQGTYVLRSHFCPCGPMARAAKLLGRSYLFTWMLTAVLFVGGIACFCVTPWLDGAAVYYVPLFAIIAWICTGFGVFVTLLVAIVVGFARWLLGERFTRKSFVLVVTYVVAMVLLNDLARHLRKHLTRRYGPTNHQTMCSSTGCCCYFHLLGDCVEIAEETRRYELPDEIPAYEP